MDKKIIKKIYIILIAVAVILSFKVFLKRMAVENGYKKYEMIMTYEDIKKMAQAMDVSVEKMLSDLKNAGITTVSINEKSISSVKFDSDFKVNVSYYGNDIVIKGDKKGLDFIQKGLEEVIIDKDSINRVEEKTLVITSKEAYIIDDNTVVRDFVGNKSGTSQIGTMSMIENVGLGYLDSEINKVNQSGLKLILRPKYESRVQLSKESADRAIKYIKKYAPSQSYVYPIGETFLGADDIEYTAKKFKENGISLALVEASTQREHLEQKGSKELIEKNDYQMIRLFTTWPYIVLRFDYGIPGHSAGQEIMNSYYRAISERNIRLILFRPFVSQNGSLVTDMEVYKARLSELENRLSTHHAITTDDAVAMKPMDFDKDMALFAAIGTFAAFALLCNLIVKRFDKFFFTLFVLSVFGSVAFYKLGIMAGLMNKSIGLLASVTFPSLAMIASMYAVKKITEKGKKSDALLSQFFISSGLLVLFTLITMLGCVIVTTFYASSKYFLELDTFTGVKISQILPLVITVISYLSVFDIPKKLAGEHSSFIQKILNDSVKVWQMCVIFVIFGVLAVFILRSGHSNSNIQPPTLELVMRNYLELIFPARPRTKDFILGFPFGVMLFYFAFQNRYKYTYLFLLLGMTIGQSDIINTFCHIRTPLYLSIERVAIGLAMGITAGLIYILAIKIIEYLRGKYA